MKNTLLLEFGTFKQRVKNAIISLKKKKGIIILDDENRENEGDIVFSAENITIEQMALTIRHGSGIVCLCITEKHRKKLKLPMMVKKNTSFFKTQFTITIEAAKGITTGVSAHDRLTTVHAAIADNAKPSDLNRPGHVFPLCANSGGLLSRRGHTEATIEILKLAKLKPVGILCELTNDDGSMAKLKEIIIFAKKNNMSIITVKDLMMYNKW
ncbi:3,4-dihydroxy-2-butanone-4-phosphate synthase [Candidatus Tachikawaea gelatinosa]|uniref:3,4-dihydroxy-2-butanone 4-phosphate synthase n=1 Tax=Candidatus Tachikawaea gelatinosa TaxID=1410383 RepID=A0A090AJD8_9ENTR|nr:3,4-dihydroxy-2-butanone-4-phosphate synthase [Candidatus Tachikawaea gelatinosa]BAP58558.1 3 4-dihydroxy-2-butanone 4-phosphate synthase [Candidatus Tachikawaea gelatinosa]